MFRKAKQFVAGVLANSADINMKKAKHFKAYGDARQREHEQWKSEGSPRIYNDTRPYTDGSYGWNKAKRKYNKAQRQYKMADKLMGY